MVSRDTSWARSGDREALREALLEALDEALDRGLGILLLYTPSRGLSRFEGGESVILRISLFEPMNIGPTCGEDFGDPAATGSGDVLTLPFPCPSGKITSTSSENVLKKSLGHWIGLLGAGWFESPDVLVVAVDDIDCVENSVGELDVGNFFRLFKDVECLSYGRICATSENQTLWVRSFKLLFDAEKSSEIDLRELLVDAHKSSGIDLLYPHLGASPASASSSQGRSISKSEWLTSTRPISKPSTPSTSSAP